MLSYHPVQVTVSLFTWLQHLWTEIQKVQNAAVRLLARSSRMTHITPILCSLHWLPIHFQGSGQSTWTTVAVNLSCCPLRGWEKQNNKKGIWQIHCHYLQQEGILRPIQHKKQFHFALIDRFVVLTVGCAFIITKIIHICAEELSLLHFEVLLMPHKVFFTSLQEFKEQDYNHFYFL